MYGGVGLGTFPFANPFTPVTREDVTDILDAYFGRGGIYIDTAPTYAFGAVEEQLGEYLRDKPRDGFVVSTSCGYVRDGDGFRISGRREDVRRDMEETLERLGLDYVDIYISHVPDEATPFEETASALQALLEEGLTKRIGVSNVDAAQLARYCAGGAITLVQNRLSYLNRTIGADLEKECEQRGVAMVAYQVIERGLLTTRGPRGLRKDDLRQRKPEFDQARVARVRRFVEDELMPLARDVGEPVEVLAMRWALAQPIVELIQVGATSASQVHSLPLGVTPLDAELVREMDNRFKSLEAALASEGSPSVRAFLGLVDYDVRSGSASGS